MTIRAAARPGQVGDWLTLCFNSDVAGDANVGIGRPVASSINVAFYEYAIIEFRTLGIAVLCEGT